MQLSFIERLEKKNAEWCTRIHWTERIFKITSYIVVFFFLVGYSLEREFNTSNTEEA